MSTSSCPKNESDEDVKDAFTAEREKEVFDNARVLVKELVIGLCSPSLTDMAFHLDKPKIIKRVLEDLVKELEEMDYEC